MQYISSEKKNYNAIDLAKLICAILVVTIHIEPFGVVDPGQALIGDLNFFIQHYLARLAVPFFFISSGFLLYRKTSYKDFDIGYSKSYLLRIVRLYLVWTIIYFPLILPGILHNEEGLASAVWGYVKSVIITGSYAHLWYFPALILAVALISFLLSKEVSKKVILIVSSGLYFLGLFAQSWYGFILPLKQLAPEVWDSMTLIMEIIETTRNGLFDGFLFVSMGMYIAFSDIRLKPEKAVSLFGFSMLAMLFEVILLHRFGSVREHDMYLFLAPAAFFLFCFIIKVELPDSPKYKTMRYLSSLIFYIHVWVMTVVNKAFDSAFKPLSGGCALFVITLLVTVILSYSVIKLSGYKRFRWLKVLYM